jgi:hypothetical protein
VPKPRTVGPHPKTGKLVDSLSSTELRQQLVEDALAGHITDLDWFTAAIQRIAEREHISNNDAIEEVWAEVASLGGFLPGLA